MTKGQVPGFQVEPGNWKNLKKVVDEVFRTAHKPTSSSAGTSSEAQCRLGNGSGSRPKIIGKETLSLFLIVG
jgi:hypothetical protein